MLRQSSSISFQQTVLWLLKILLTKHKRPKSLSRGHLQVAPQPPMPTFKFLLQSRTAWVSLSGVNLWTILFLIIIALYDGHALCIWFSLRRGIQDSNNPGPSLWSSAYDIGKINFIRGKIYEARVSIFKSVSYTLAGQDWSTSIVSTQFKHLFDVDFVSGSLDSRIAQV